MNSMDSVADRREYAAALEKLADKIASAPDKWVLFLGSDVSAVKGNERRRMLSELARELCAGASADPAAPSMSPATGAARDIRQAVQENDFAKLSDTLFGNIWDGASLLDEDTARNIRLREKYAKRLHSRDEINVRTANKDLHLRELIGAFRGMILTTCQDEVVEAFWEYENSLPADTIVHTPQIIEGSNYWSRWLHTPDEDATYLQSQDESLTGIMTLVKLFGSRDNPTGMLLSKQDLEEFYPSKKKREEDHSTDWDSVNTILFLKKIFGSRNILFVGVNLEDDWLLKAADGIWDLLEEKSSSSVERYALLSKGLDSPKHHVHLLDGVSGADSVLKELSELLGSRQVADADSPAEGADEDVPLQDKKKILDLFWQFYNRRPQRLFMQVDKPNSNVYNTYSMEYTVLKNDILGFQSQEEASRVWTPKSIRQLAIAANNFSDFYDLRDAMELEKAVEGEPYEARIPRLLSSRFSKKSLLLYRILRRYESGFPVGFLRLLPKEEYGLKSWRRAGIQLANSGVYVQRHGKQKLYERLRYADCVMRTAGKSPFQARIRNEVDAIDCSSMYSYLYPFHNVEIAGSNDISKEEIDTHFTKMFRTLYDILRDKSEEYQQIYSLLQTELPAIVKMMYTLPDEKLEWKPGLLYYLLLESRVSVDRGDLLESLVNVNENDELLTYCDKLLAYCDELEKKCREKGEPQWRLFSERLMVHQAKALIKSQSFDIQEQQAAADECQTVEESILEAHNQKTFWKDEIPSEIFKHRIRACFLRSTILGRMSTICEIERCDKELPECTKQLSLLEEMDASLRYAKNMIDERKSTLGERCKELRSELARLKGEYHFKMSQYYGENRRFAKEDCWAEEKNCYEKAEGEYESALKYYKCSPGRYWIQYADTLRSMGDMHCQWMRSVNEALAKGLPESKDCKALKEKCYDNLIDAYVLYRRHFDLQGVADVLQSMGQAEGYNEERETNELRRTRLCYYKASVDMYRHLGDAWSYRVVCSFLRGGIIEAGGI